MLYLTQSFFGKTAVAALGMSGLLQPKPPISSGMLGINNAAGRRKEKKMQNEIVIKLQRDAYHREFPWLSGYIQYNDGSISVQRMDKKLLDEKKLFVVLDGPNAGKKFAQNIYLLGEHGDLLIEVGEQKYSFGQKIRRLFMSSDKKDYQENWGPLRSETVGTALFRLGKDQVDKVHYILVKRFNNFTIYKLPKGFTLAEWMDEIQKESRQKLDGELKEADRVVISLPPPFGGKK